MFWKILTLVVNLTFLLLASTIMVILLNNESYREDLFKYKLAVTELREESSKIRASNFSYLENKINRVAENQDSYQINMDRRLSVLENRQRMLEGKGSSGSRIINNNSAIANSGSKEQQQ